MSLGECYAPKCLVLTILMICFVCRLAIKSLSMRLLQYRLQCVQERRGGRPKDNEAEYQNIEIYSTLVSVMSTEILFYPFETILHRIQLQGTRTIIDNLDTGYSVVPILTSYEGAADCCRSTIAAEGISGLYKGSDAPHTPSSFVERSIFFSIRSFFSFCRIRRDGSAICCACSRYQIDQMDCHTGH